MFADACRAVKRTALAAGVLLAGPAGITGVTPPARAAGTITLLGQLPLADAGQIMDVWGYVDPSSGKEYALVPSRGVLGGIAIVDVSNPANPTQVSRATGAVGFDVKVRGTLAYSVTGSVSGSGGRIFDLSSILSPTLVTTFPSAHNIFIDTRGFLYLANTGSLRDLRIYTLNNDPLAPELIWDDAILSDHDVAVVDTFLYDFHGVNGTKIYSVNNLSASTPPVLLGEINDPAIAFSHSGYPTADGRYLFINDELATHPSPDITVWNIENLAAPFKVAEIADTNATVHNIYIVGNFAYVSYYTSGFRVYDVSDPTQPILSDEFDTSSKSGEGFRGAFGVYPFAPSGSIYVSDMDNGLFVFSFSGAQTAVTISAFDAAYRNGAARLSWEIASADALEGFYVYRSLSVDEGYARVNPELLPAASMEYADRSVDPGGEYWYRLGAVDRDGEFLSPPRRVAVPARSLRLAQNAPNPFNPSTVIAYDLPHTGHATLVVYDARGRRIRILVDEAQQAGARTVTWNGRDDAGRAVASGTYFYRIVVDGISDAKKMLLLK